MAEATKAHLPGTTFGDNSDEEIKIRRNGLRILYELPENMALKAPSGLTHTGIVDRSILDDIQYRSSPWKRLNPDIDLRALAENRKFCGVRVGKAFGDVVKADLKIGEGRAAG